MGYLDSSGLSYLWERITLYVDTKIPSTDSDYSRIDHLILGELPEKTVYKPGEYFDPTGMVIYGILDDGTGLVIEHSRLRFQNLQPFDSIAYYDVVIGVAVESTTKTVAVPVTCTKIFGVYWDGGPKTKLVRTDDSSNFDDPVPSIENSEGSSPFDDYYPWAGMQIVEIEGQSFVSIPKFYLKVTHGNDYQIHIQISPLKIDGWYVSPVHRDRGDGQGERDIVYVARYLWDGSDPSKTGVLVALPSNLGTDMVRYLTDVINTYSDEWVLADFWFQLTLLYLYIVEYADWHSQSTIGPGMYVSGYGGSSPDRFYNGYTNNMPYHTGRIYNDVSASLNSVQYRNLENIWSCFAEPRPGLYLWNLRILDDDVALSYYMNPRLYIDILTSYSNFENTILPNEYGFTGLYVQNFLTDDGISNNGKPITTLSARSGYATHFIRSLDDPTVIFPSFASRYVYDKMRQIEAQSYMRNVKRIEMSMGFEKFLCAPTTIRYDYGNSSLFTGGATIGTHKDMSNLGEFKQSNGLMSFSLFWPANGLNSYSSVLRFMILPNKSSEGDDQSI